MISSKRIIGVQNNLVRNDNGQWVWQELTEYEVSSDSIEVDLKGVRGEINRVESLLRDWQEAARNAENEVDLIGANREIEKLTVELNNLKSMMRGLQAYLSAMNDPIPEGDIPDRPREEE